jgi:hypothetical protein
MLPRATHLRVMRLRITTRNSFRLREISITLDKMKDEAGMKTRIVEESRLRVLVAATEQEQQPYTTLADVDISAASALVA